MTVPTTPLDLAHAAMQAAPEDPALRLRFYERLADNELFLLLAEEVNGAVAKPLLLPVEGQNFALIFDTEARLAEFVDTPTPFLALSGRQVVQMLAGRDVGVGLNLGVAPSAILLEPEAVTWLVNQLAQAPQTTQGQVKKIAPPTGLPETLITALDAKLATMPGLARAAFLVRVTYQDGTNNPMLAFVDALTAAESAIAAAVNEALTFSGLEAGQLDVAFLNRTDPLCAKLAEHGLRFDLPEPPQPETRKVTAPGSDPDQPPILR